MHDSDEEIRASVRRLEETCERLIAEHAEYMKLRGLTETKGEHELPKRDDEAPPSDS